ncbi:uncharacterized protein LOC144904251 [Branchiostoma floridae x Branchiostoma belcheri]
MNLEVGVEEISELRMSESDEKTRNRDTSELECPRSTDKDSVSLETEKTVQESNISSSPVDTRSQDVSKCQSTLVDKDIAMETEEREIAPPHPDIEEATDGERKDFHSVTSQPLVTTETEHPNDVEETDHTTIAQEMTQTKADVLSLETRSKTQPELSTDTMEIDNMETNNVDVIQAHPVTRQDGIDTAGAVKLQQEEPYTEETPGGEGNVQESSESESTSSEESESSSDSSDSEDEEEEEVKNDKVKQDQPSQAKEEVVTLVTPDVPVEEFPDIILPEDVQLKAIGKISSIIGQLVVVQAYPNTPALDAETLLFNTDRQSIGVVNDTFGPVIQPCYSIQFSSAKKIEAVGLNLQHEIFFAPEVQDFTVYVFTQNLIKQKGSDASWKNDQEPPPEFLDYSDDEQEKMAKKSLKEAKGKKPKPRKAFKRDPEFPRTDSGYPPSQHYQGPGPSGWRGGWHGTHSSQEQWSRRPQHDYNVPQYPPPFDPPQFPGPPPGPPPPFLPPTFGWNQQPHAMNVRPLNYGPPPPAHHVNPPPLNMRLPFPPPPPPPPPPMRDGQGGGGRPSFHPHHYSGPPPQEMFPPMQFPFPPPPPPPPPPSN